jgi:hypothetical protein
MTVTSGRRGLVVLYGATVALLVAAAMHSALTGSPAWLFTRDPAAIHVSDPMLGALSNLGAVLWAAAASVTLFAAALLRSPQVAEVRAYLAYAGALTAWLLLDDLYMFHERVLPDSVGVPQWLVLTTYVVLVAGLCARFRRLIVATDYRLLAVAGACFALSIASDQAPGAWHRLDWLVFVEDGAKLLGIASWLAYFTSTAARALRGELTDPE